MPPKKTDEELKFYANIGNKIKQLRIKEGLTQAYLAKVVKTSQEVIAGYEKGSISIPVTIIKKIADFFNVSVDYLIAKPGSLEELIYSINIHDFINLKGLSCLNSKATGIADVSLHALSEIYSSNNKALISEINRDLL